MSDNWRDQQWNRDYLSALKELTGPAPRLMLPVLEVPFTVHDRMKVQPMHDCNVPTVEHDFNPESREDVLGLVRIVKTPKPGMRAVFYDGVLIGKIGKNPYGLGWVASCTRSTLYWSQQDAALALVEDVGGAR
jgi:hypothetical protein